MTEQNISKLLNRLQLNKVRLVEIIYNTNDRLNDLLVLTLFCNYLTVPHKQNKTRCRHTRISYHERRC